MTTNSIQNKHQTMLTRRFQFVVVFTIIMLSMAIFSTLFFGKSFNTIGLLTLDVLIMSSLFLLIKMKQIDLAKQIFIWSNLIVLSCIFWMAGGLLSISIVLVYPLFLMVAVQLGGPRTFVSVYFFVVGLIILISVNTINGNDNNAIISGLGYWDLSIAVILISAAGYTAWRFNEDMRYALRKLKTEVANVKQSRTEIERLIHFDSLTGLSSRLGSEKKYSVLKNELNELSEQVYFLFLDIDNFKSINDYYNHSVGDEVLKQVAGRLLWLRQNDDIVCRLSGDEFLLILTRPKNFDIEQSSRHILQNVSKSAKIFDNNIEITASLGISIRDKEKDDSFEALLKRADLAMYRAKTLGKNKTSFYDEELSLKSSRKNKIIKGLKTAFRNNDLELFLQPKVDIVSGKIESAEALIRWVRNNPENISPGEFIPLIESTELICDLGEWVISRACVLCKELHNDGFEEISISVNISSAQFLTGDLENIIIRELQKSQLHPKYLELELTEYILFQDDKNVQDELSRIKELGVTLSIDDFGTGYSNLSYLTKFKVDTLKIDRSFVTDINILPKNFAIVDAIIKMAKALGLSIVAEGVETQEEWDVLKQLGCDQGQGFIWSRALASNDFLKHLSKSV